MANKKKPVTYSGELIRFYCPSLYGKPVYDATGKVIPYKIVVPTISQVSAEEISGK